MWNDILKLISKWKSLVDFLIVYIQEAHASDEWPIEQLEVEIRQHQTIEERLVAARRFIKDFNSPADIPFLADNMRNEFNNHYASWPFRFWILRKRANRENAEVRFKAMPRNSAYYLQDLDDALVDELSN